MRVQASLETMIAIILMLSLTVILLVVFTRQRDEVLYFEEEYGARQVCFTIRNTIISDSENGTRISVVLPTYLNGRYTIAFLGTDVNVKTERGFVCTITQEVYNSTNSSSFEINPGELTFTNLEGIIYLNSTGGAV